MAPHTAVIAAYARMTLHKSVDSVAARKKRLLSRLGPRDRQFVSSFFGLLDCLAKYKSAAATDKALDSVDLGAIYSGAEKREKEKSQASKLQYEDFLVLELLDYFKNKFFQWVTKPECPRCHNDKDNIVSVGTQKPPTVNPDSVSVVEVYKCVDCGTQVTFPRINSPARLLETRKGRCGEWVNCFMLILHAVLGEDAQLRYVWNYEDHVWCEYYSQALHKWVHLDPCENVFDEPSLYCENWGKKMSWVLGFNDTYIVDLSEKYITNSERQIPQASIVDSVALVSAVIKMAAIEKMSAWFAALAEQGLSAQDASLRLYYRAVLLYQQETKRPAEHAKAKLTTKGRQTGGEEWTTLRGENGSS